MHGHELHGVCPAWAWLSPASSAAWVKGDQRRGFAGVGVDDACGVAGAGWGLSGSSSTGAFGSRPWLYRALGGLLRERLAVLIQRQGHGIAAKAFLRDEALGGVDQFLQVLDAVGAFAFRCGSAPPGRWIRASAR